MELENPTEADRKKPLKRSLSMPVLMPSDMKCRAGPIRPVATSPVEEPEHGFIPRLDIDRKVEDVIAMDTETALFECKVVQDINPTCTWHKDGKTLQSDDERISIIKNGPWHRLQITHVTASDQGLYTIECHQRQKYISVKGHLYVAPQDINKGAFYHKTKYTGPGVIRHLLNLKVFKGETIHLTAQFNFEVNEITWYKNNDVALQDQRITIVNYGPNVSMTIKNAKPTDAGIYYAVAKTDEGYLSTFADVQVGDRNEIRQLLPIIDENFPQDQRTVVGEEVRLAAKVYTDKNTIIKWYKDSVVLESDDNKKVDYGNNYIGLTITNPSAISSGYYQLTLKNGISYPAVSASLHLTVLGRPLIVEEVDVLRPIHSAVACCGSKVSFDCEFDLEDPIYFYVVWYVGHYKVERTNSLFTVVCNGGRFILYIKKIEPSMAGDVICELRQANTYRRTAMINRTYAHLVIVPRPMIEEAMLAPVDYGKLYNEPNENKIRLVGEEDDIQSSVEEEKFLLKIIYCRLENNLHYINAVRGWDSTDTELKIRGNYTTENESLEISWQRSTLGEYWFGIDLGQKDGSFVETAISSNTKFLVSGPPLDRIMVFRVREVQPVEDASADVVIVPPPEIEMQVAASVQMEFVDVYESKYVVTDEIIGTGTFGNVLLIRDHQDYASYAAKYIAAKTSKKKEYILREFNIMKNLRHPQLIHLLGFYEAPTAYIFVMEYCWGGDLFDRIVADEYMIETDVVGYVKQICVALQYMHGQGVAHLDVKPENIICISPNSRQVKLIDFGLARRVDAENSLRTFYGTRDYVAPEVIDYEPVSTATDMWSLGVLTYLLLSGNMPFYATSAVQRASKIVTGQYEYDEYSFRDISEVAKDFIDKLLVVFPTMRLSATLALQHPWIVDGPPQGARPALMHVMRLNMKSYLAFNQHKWQRAGYVVRAAHGPRRAVPPDDHEVEMDRESSDSDN